MQRNTTRYMQRNTTKYMQHHKTKYVQHDTPFFPHTTRRPHREEECLHIHFLRLCSAVVGYIACVV